MKKLLPFLLLCSCATATGQNYSGLPTIVKGNSQVVIYRPAEFGVPNGGKIVIDGVEKCSLPPKSFAVENVNPGTNHVSASVVGGGTSSINLDTKAGERHYIRLTYDRGASAGAGFGLIGALASQELAGGPFDMVDVSEQQALRELSQTKETPSCL